jgi:hypothetical protein
MGNDFSSGASPGGAGNNNQKDKDGEKKRKWEPPVPPPRVGRKQKKREASNAIGGKLPVVTPNAKCKLRLLKLERVKDYLLMEEEFVANQVRDQHLWHVYRLFVALSSDVRQETVLSYAHLMCLCVCRDCNIPP